MKTLLLGTLAMGLLVISAPVAPVAAQDDRAAARQHFNAGVEAFQAGRAEAALQEFQEAYRLAPHPSVRVNMANCYEQLQRPLEAMFHYERFLAESPDAPAAQRAEVSAALEELRGHVGELTLRIAPDGALVRIDESEVRRAPIMNTIRLVEGSHVVEIRADGYRSVRREFVVEGGQPAEVAVRLERGDDPDPEPLPVATAAPLGASAGSPVNPAPPPGDDLNEAPRAETDDGGGWVLTTPTIIAGAATGALLVGTIVTGSLSLVANSDFEDAVLRSNDSTLSAMERAQARQDGLDASSRANTLSTVTDILLISTIVGAGATAALFFLTQPDGDDQVASGPRIRGATVAATPDGAALVVAGDLF